MNTASVKTDRLADARAAGARMARQSPLTAKQSQAVAGAVKGYAGTISTESQGIGRRPMRPTGLT